MAVAKKNNDEFVLDPFAQKSHDRFVEQLKQMVVPDSTEPGSVHVTGGDLEVIRASESSDSSAK